MFVDVMGTIKSLVCALSVGLFLAFAGTAAHAGVVALDGPVTADSSPHSLSGERSNDQVVPGSGTSASGLGAPEFSTWAMFVAGFVVVGIVAFSKRRRDSRYAL
jgi:hypothetical protein